MKTKTKNQIYWDTFNKRYGRTWHSQTKTQISALELSFIQRFIPQKKRANILDVGVGTGRILNLLEKNSKQDASLYGIDISQKMVDFCNNIFKQNKKIKKLKRISLSLKKEKIFTAVSFDFISAIRVLKYNKDWKVLVKILTENINKNGILVFTMPNKKSLNIFAHYSIPFYKSDYSEIAQLLTDLGFTILDVRTFSRIPDVFYTIPLLKNIVMYSVLLTIVEKSLAIVFGPYHFGRILFVAAQKK